MTNIIVSGHGGLGTAIQRNLNMLLGDTPGMFYVDFNPEDSLDILAQKYKDALAKCGQNEVLFACDLNGGSPFRQAAMLCIDHPERRAIAGMNISAYAEIAYSLDLPVDQLCDLAAETTRSTVQIFPPRAE